MRQFHPLGDVARREAVEKERIRARAALDHLGTTSSHVARYDDDDVVSAAAEDLIGVQATVQLVSLRAAIEPVFAHASVESVLPRTADQDVGTIGAQQNIITDPAQHLVTPKGSVEQIVTCLALQHIASISPR